MMTKVKLVTVVGIALAAAVLAGWIWGAARRPAAARGLQASELRNELLGARAAVLDARLAIYAVNFGEASQHLEGARWLLGRADTRLSTLGRTAGVRQLATARARRRCPAYDWQTRSERKRASGRGHADRGREVGRHPAVDADRFSARS